MTIAVKQILSQDRQADARDYKKSYKSAPKEAEEATTGYSVDHETGYHLSLQRLARTRSLNQYLGNANDGISLVQIITDALNKTDSALDEIGKVVDWHEPGYRYDQERMVNLLKELYSISQKTNFNKQPLLDGKLKEARFAVGEGVGEYIPIALSSVAPHALGFGWDFADVLRKWQKPDGYKLVVESEKQNVDIVGNAKHSVADIRANLAPLQERFEKAVAELQKLSDNTGTAANRIKDSDIAKEVAVMTREMLLKESRSALEVQANQQAPIALKLLE